MCFVSASGTVLAPSRHLTHGGGGDEGVNEPGLAGGTEQVCWGAELQWSHLIGSDTHRFRVAGAQILQTILFCLKVLGSFIVAAA